MEAETEPIAETPKPRRLKAPVRREEILAAATRVFSEKSYAASMGDVAKAAGTIRTALYYYFPGKEELFLAVADSVETEMLRHLLPAITQSTLEERARAAVHSIIRFGQEHPGFWNILIPHGDALDPGVLTLREKMQETAVAILGSIMQEADVAQLDPHSNRLRIMGEMLLGGAVQVMTWWHDNPTVSLEDIEDAVFDLVWLGSRAIAPNAAI